MRATYQGGDRYSPINQAASIVAQNPVFNESLAFSQQFPAAFTTHLTINYKVNKVKTTREIAFKLLNATMYKEFVSFQYNFTTHTVDERRKAIFIPNLSYKIEF